jgi:hypothetical protein
MSKTRNHSVYSDFKTGLLYKLFFIIGFTLVVFYLIERFSRLLHLQEPTLDAILAFAVLFIGGSLLLYFIHCQFAKLAQIAEEIENEEDETPES